MTFDDRLQFLLLGLVIGFVLGYFVRLVKDTRDIKNEVHDVKEELDEVDEIVKELKSHDRDERGFMRPTLKGVAMLLIVGLTAYAAIVSQRASNKVADEVERSTIVSECNLTTTADALNALNQRSTYTVSQTQANVDLQSDFADLINLLLHRPPYSEDIRLKAFEKYQKSLNSYVALAGATVIKVEDNPFPTEAELRACVRKGTTEGEQ